MIRLDDLVLFVRAVESGSFAAAARRLGLPRSTVAKRVAELEVGLGVRLLHRTSRSFGLTDIGRAFHDHARAATIEAEAAQEVVQRRLAEPSGRVRITASVPTAQAHLADRLPDLARAFPRLTIDLHVTDRFVDLMHEGFDVAVRSHFAPLPDSDLVCRRMASEAVVLVAAPDYVAARGSPQRPADLAGHDGLLSAPAATTWRLLRTVGAGVEVAPRPAMIADESTVLLKAAVGGLGVACLPETMVRSRLDAGTLVRLLPEWTAGTVTTTLLTAPRRGRLPSVRAVVDFLADGRDVLR